MCIRDRLYAFSPHPSTPPQVNPPPSPTSTLPLGFVHVSFIVVPVDNDKFHTSSRYKESEEMLLNQEWLKRLNEESFVIKLLL